MTGIVGNPQVNNREKMDKDVDPTGDPTADNISGGIKIMKTIIVTAIICLTVVAVCYMAYKDKKK